MDQKNIWAALKAVVTNIFKKKQIHGNSSEESCNLKVPLVKLKKQKTSKRTYRKKTVPNIPSYKDDRRAESENSDDTNLRNVSVIKLQKKKTDARVHILSKDSTHSSEGSCDFSSKVTLVKRKTVCVCNRL